MSMLDILYWLVTAAGIIVSMYYFNKDRKHFVEKTEIKLRMIDEIELLRSKCEELARTVERKDELLSKQRMELDDYTIKLNKEASQVISLVERLNAMADKLALTTARRDALEEAVTNQEYRLREYAQVVTDPKSMKEFITWQSQRRQQDELLNLLTGQSSVSQPKAEETMELASRTSRPLTPPVSGLMPVTPDPIIPSHEENAKMLFSESPLTTTSSDSTQLATSNISSSDTSVPEAISERPIVHDDTYKGV